MSIDIGIGQRDRQAVSDGLGRLLADSYPLYLKTHNYHWNVTGPLFSTLHTNDAGSYIRVGDRSHENTVFDDGFAVVKASWSARVHDRASGQDGALVRGNDGNNYEQDEPSDLYIIAKMRDAPASETDGGWVYGIVARGGERVLESGRIDSCIRCHSKAPSGGLFGLDAEGREAARASLGFSGEVQGPQS